jgi:hypothetical protein
MRNSLNVAIRFIRCDAQKMGGALANAPPTSSFLQSLNQVQGFESDGQVGDELFVGRDLTETI